MRVIARKTLMKFWTRPGCGDAEQPLRAWFHEAKKADWSSPAEIKAIYCNASIIGNNRVVFNIGGKKYRLVVAIQYPARIVFIRFIGSHAEYDRINAEEV